MEMPTPNGTTQMWFTGEYRDIVENKRLVYTEHSWSEAIPRSREHPAG
jgi:uncharacterized protein YndB with AHSA1/START domain